MDRPVNIQDGLCHSTALRSQTQKHCGMVHPPAALTACRFVNPLLYMPLLPTFHLQNITLISPSSYILQKKPLHVHIFN